MKISFICPVINHARFQRRFKFLSDLGSEIQVYAYERDYYSGDLFIDDYTKLGNVEDANYIKRLIPYFSSLNKIKKAINDSDVIYVFSLDILLLVQVILKIIKKDVKLIYEVGDIRSILTGDSLKAKFFRYLEKKSLKEVDKLIVTSEAYINGYFKDILEVNNLSFQVIENKVLRENIQNNNKIYDPSCQITIGYFGMLRCQRSWKILQRIINTGNGKINLYLRGLNKGLKNFEEVINNNKNIIYEGPYKSPNDLEEIYNKVDIVWACYPYQNKKESNWKWARTTRFYESAFFKIPMIAQSGTEDARIIEKHDIGKNIDLEDIDQAVKKFLDIKKSDLLRWHNNLLNIPKDLYLYTDEHQKLYNFLQK